MNSDSQVSNSNQYGNGDQRIKVYCTRPQQEGEFSYPHITSLDPQDIFENPQGCRCAVCGMPLILRDRFVPVERLGQGGFGITFLAKDLDLRKNSVNLKESIEEARSRVIKLFHTMQPLSEELSERAKQYFENEGQILDKLNNQGVPRFIGLFKLRFLPDTRLCGDETNTENYHNRYYLYLIQEYIKGRDLENELTARLSEGKQFTESEIKELLKQILTILREIHNRGILHRDISPQNIILRGDRYYLIDFGAAKQKVEDEVSVMLRSGHRSIVGNPQYMPLEQAGGRELDPSADLFSLAATCVRLLTAQWPQRDLGIRDNLVNWKTHAQVTPRFAAILDRMLAKHPNNRYRTAEEVLRAVNPSPEPIGWKWLLFASLGVILGLSITGVALLKYIFNNPTILTLITSKVNSIINPVFTSQDYSRGEKILLKSTSDFQNNSLCYDAYKLKENATKNFKNALSNQNRKDLLDAAQNSFQQTVETLIEINHPDCLYDPEALIGLNNAWALRKGNPITLAVVISGNKNDPVRISRDTAALTGVAIAQTQANGIHVYDGKLDTPDVNEVGNKAESRPIQILIIREESIKQLGRKAASEKTQRVAQALASSKIQNFNGSIVGVIGHYDSQNTAIAAQIYADVGIPLISPTSTAIRKTEKKSLGFDFGKGENVFRISPSDTIAATDLSNYAKGATRIDKVLVFFTSGSPYSTSLKQAFVDEFNEINVIPCDIDENMEGKLDKIKSCFEEINSDETGLMLALPSENIEDAKNILGDARKKLVLAGDALYSNQMADFVNSVLSVPWHNELLEEPFRSQFTNMRIPAEIDWRTGTSHDATLVLIEAINKTLNQQTEPDRIGVLNALKETNIKGITGNIQFCPSGDRRVLLGVGVLVRVTDNGNNPFELLDKPGRSLEDECPDE